MVESGESEILYVRPSLEGNEYCIQDNWRIWHESESRLHEYSPTLKRPQQQQQKETKLDLPLHSQVASQIFTISEVAFRKPLLSNFLSVIFVWTVN